MRKLACIFILAIGCDSEGDDSIQMMDAGFPDIGTIEAPCAPEVAAPEPVDPPRAIEWACPTGWREVERTCSPWPETGPNESCPQGEAHFPGTPGCAPIGTQCPPGQFAEPPAAYAAWNRIYVDRAATPGMDGLTQDTPTSSFLGAIRRASEATSPTVVMISKGQYPVLPTTPIPDDTLLWGACVRDTIIKTSTASRATAVMMGAPGSGGAIGNLTLSSNTIALGVAGEGNDLTVQGVLIEEAQAIGIGAVSGATLLGERLVVHNVSRRLADAAGLALQEGAHAELSRVIIADNVNYGAAIEAGSDAIITDVVVARNGFGGFFVRGECTLMVERAALSANSAYGMHAEGGRIVGRDVVISDSVDTGDLTPGRGIVISRDGPTETIPGSVVLDGALIERNIRTGIYIGQQGSSLELSDALIRDTAPRLILGDDGVDSLSGGGLALHVSEGTTARLERVLMERNSSFSIVVADTGASLTANDLIVSDTQPGLDTFGLAIMTRRTATSSLTRALIDGTTGNAMEVIEGGQAFLHHLTIRDSAVTETGTAACGMLISDEGTSVALSHALIERNELYGIIVEYDASLDLSHARIAETNVRPTDGIHGIGLAVVDRARVVGHHVALEENRGAGFVMAREGRLELTELAVRRTKASPITFDGYVSGRGASIEDAAEATITNAIFEDNLDIGLFVEGAKLTLTNAAILRTAPVEDIAGRGIQSQAGARVDLEKVCLEDNTEAGLVATEAELYGRDVRVLGTKRNPCFVAGTCQASGGLGVYSAPGGRMTLSTFEICDNEETGVVVAGGEMDLASGLVCRNKLGADVRDPQFDTGRITATVRYFDNENDGVESQSTILPDTNTDGLY